MANRQSLMATPETGVAALGARRQFDCVRPDTLAAAGDRRSAGWRHLVTEEVLQNRSSGPCSAISDSPAQPQEEFETARREHDGYSHAVNRHLVGLQPFSVLGTCHNARQENVRSMNSDKFYSHNARRCRTLAQRARTEYGRDLLIELARRWDELIADKDFLARLPERLDNAEIGQTKFQPLSRSER